MKNFKKNVYVVTLDYFEDSWNMSRNLMRKWTPDVSFTENECSLVTNRILGIYTSMRKARKAMKEYCQRDMRHVLTYPNDYDVTKDVSDVNEYTSIHYRTIEEEAIVADGERRYRTRSTLSIHIHELNK